MVMADYGKNKCYIIETVLFDVTLESHQFNYQGRPVNILEYYSQCYGIAIQSKKQPLLKAKSNRKCKDQEKEKENEVILVPELCLMSGLPDDFDERKRREVSEVTITSPGAKLKDIEDMFKALSSTHSEFNPKAIG
jgi:aubergine-like protein